MYFPMIKHFTYYYLCRSLASIHGVFGSSVVGTAPMEVNTCSFVLCTREPAPTHKVITLELYLSCER